VNVTVSLCTSISVATFLYSSLGILEDECVFLGSGGVFLQKQRNIKWCNLKYKET
jgi:hypothetical protein